MTKVEKIIVGVAVALACVAFVMLLRTAKNYKTAGDEYEELQQYASSESADEAEMVSGIAPLILDEEDDTKKPLAQNFNRSDFPDIQVDFEKLVAKNQDCVAWIYMGACGISYPVVQGEDNDYYMHHTFEDTNNSSGAIIMDFRDNKHLKDWNTFIYGHNMKNGSMFGSLKKLLKDDTLYDQDPYFYVFIPGYIYRYKIFSYYKDAPDSKMYWTPDTLQEYRQYIRDAKSKSVRECNVETSEDNNMVTLVTCSGSGEGKQRFFVHGEFIDRYQIMHKRETEEASEEEK